MVEFAIGASALVLLMLGVVTLSGYQEVQRRTALMARQSAFHGAWLGNRQSLRAAEATLEQQYLQGVALMDATGHQALVAKGGSKLVALDGYTPGLAQTLGNGLLAPLKVVGGFLGGQFDLTQAGYRNGNVEVRIAPIRYLPPPFDQLELKLQQPYGLLSDAWHSGSSTQVVARTSGLVPTGALAAWSGAWRPLLSVLSVLEPSLSQLCLGFIEAERVPEDRLGPGVTPLPGNCL
jgi:hypothetical protein